MAQLVVNIARSKSSISEGPLSSALSRIGIKKISEEILLLGLILMTLQVLDGVLTGIGMYHFGLDAEANPMIRSLMYSFGPFLTLTVVKSLAIAVVFVLCHFATKMIWVCTALKGLVVLYLCLAVIPWTTVLISHMLPIA